jgi:hypothetical protein
MKLQITSNKPNGNVITLGRQIQTQQDKNVTKESRNGGYLSSGVQTQTEGKGKGAYSKGIKMQPTARIAPIKAKKGLATMKERRSTVHPLPRKI